MRVTQNNFYNRFIADQQSVKERLARINRQISSGMKIKYGYEDTRVFTDTLRLDYEEKTLSQAVEISSDAQTFANNTDNTMNQMTKALDRFKTLMIQAANDGVNQDNNYFAISNELKSLKSHLMDLGNTSINGRYLFSGTAVDVRPLDESGRYRGNDREIKAIIGDQVEIPYNIPGSELFWGVDSSYKKKITTNVPLYKAIDIEKADQTGIVDKRPDRPAYVDGLTTMRELNGWSGDSHFYISGRRHDGTGFKDKFTLSEGATMDQLLEEIGKRYGNTSANRAVDVRLVHGNIVIEDLQNGSSQLDFSMTASDTDVNDVKDLVDGANAHVKLFNRGGRVPDFSVSTLQTVRDPARLDRFTMEGLFIDAGNQKPSRYTTPLIDLFPDTGDITLNGTDVNGNSVSTTVAIAGNTMNDLTGAIETTFGVRVKLGSDGRLEMIDESGNDGNNFDMQMSTNLTIPAFRTEVTTESNGWKQVGSKLFSDVSQIDKNTNAFATPETRVVDVSADVSLDDLDLRIAFKDKNGVAQRARIFRDTDTVVKYEIDTNNDGSFDSGPFNVQNADGTDTRESGGVGGTHEFTMRQLTETIGIIMAGTQNTDFATAAQNAHADVEVLLDQKGRIVIRDKTATDTQMRMNIHDARSDDFSVTDGNLLSFHANNALTVDGPHHDMFGSLQQAIEAVEKGYIQPDGGNFEMARNVGIQFGMDQVDHVLAHVSKEHTKVGAMSTRLRDAEERNQTLKINVQMLRSKVLDTDIAEAAMRLNQLTVNFQAMMASVSRIQGLSLVNYMR